MEVDVYELRSAERNEASADVKEFKKTVERFRTELVKITAKNGDNEANRAALLGNRANGRDYSLEYENGRDQHSHLLDGSDALHSAGYRLQESHRLAVEAEAVGSNILNDLRSQREQIVHSRNRVSANNVYMLPIFAGKQPVINIWIFMSLVSDRCLILILALEMQSTWLTQC
ncbi:Vesicle transport v-SNARE protein vti1 [Zancudomyces culisetae]|uniref:Vesicle transport v-SNARE protein vti1 n=1 Tax=Zancudomyces culisetae TaxID=1213189 RepID=A0A1R1PEA8_ZANCU|nr:Vesicle transport v-SNARE protein vti1 [Zancudomyces culisetae]OMH79348.1 Vesicle transport v-SNARE protein vti1 [Zancudomyces culisetae]|eukprot:OMH79335.1 Vesicle transport v-SNARE protein vti1 [Zancudomyces culisetae]